MVWRIHRKADLAADADGGKKIGGGPADAAVVGSRSSRASRRDARASLTRDNAMRKSWFAVSACSTSVLSKGASNANSSI